jgi:hypothetical protein
MRTKMERQPLAGPAKAGLQTGYFRPLKQLKYQNENNNDLSNRTLFLMILGSLESQQQSLHIYAEKHHSTAKEDNTK